MVQEPLRGHCEVNFRQQMGSFYFHFSPGKRLDEEHGFWRQKELGLWVSVDGSGSTYKYGLSELLSCMSKTPKWWLHRKCENLITIYQSFVPRLVSFPLRSA